MHAPHLGNPKWLRTAAQTHEECLALYEWYVNEHPEVLASFYGMTLDWNRRGKRACLTCFERHPGDCHRGLLTAHWMRWSGGDVHHIAPDGCKRLSAIEERSLGGLFRELGIPEPNDRERLRVLVNSPEKQAKVVNL